MSETMENVTEKIVVREINGVELDTLVASILEKGIEENGLFL